MQPRACGANQQCRAQLAKHGAAYPRQTGGARAAASERMGQTKSARRKGGRLNMLLKRKPFGLLRQPALAARSSIALTAAPKPRRDCCKHSHPLVIGTAA